MKLLILLPVFYVFAMLVITAFTNTNNDKEFEKFNKIAISHWFMTMIVGLIYLMIVGLIHLIGAIINLVK